MSKLSEHYPQVRIIIYSLIAIVLAVAGSFGYVSEDQSASILSTVTSLLGAAGLVFAASKVKTAAPQVDVPAVADAVAARVNDGVQTVGATVAGSVADLRAQAEAALGSFVDTATGKHRVQ